MFKISRWWALMMMVAIVMANSEPNAHSPVLVDKNGKPVKMYHGEVPENEREVTLEPELRAIDKDAKENSYVGAAGQICGYDIIYSKNNYNQDTFPFEIDPKDVKHGIGKIMVKKNAKLNFEKRNRYKFWVRAFDCAGDEKASFSTKVRVVLRVVDVDEFAPTFDKPNYDVDVEEGVVYQKILQLSATDKDRSPVYHTVCKYSLLSKKVPFKVDKKGKLYNTEKLNWDKERNYILEVQAEDCGHKKSKIEYINVKVLKTCKPSWQGITRNIEYKAGSRTKLLFANAKFDMCSAQCHTEKVSAHINLHVKDKAMGCDRHSKGITAQRQQCNANVKTTELLPAANNKNSWTKGLLQDNEHAAFKFNGKTAIDVPDSKVEHTLHGQFTISMWMKHKKDSAPAGAKEHILCNSDGAKMNRHHYSLYVHNCRLVLLLRQEAQGNNLNVFKPAEYRWLLPEVCDGHWHHYAINGQFPNMALYIDGSPMITSKNNPEVIDDWPMHTSTIKTTKLMIGACYSAGKHTVTQYFNGSLAGLTLLRGQTEKDNVLKCLNNCHEKLYFNDMKKMTTGMTVSFNKAMTEMTINGQTVKEVENLIKNVGYINTRIQPTTGGREVTMVTYIRCKELKKINVPKVKSVITIKEPQLVKISITGDSRIAKRQGVFDKGVAIFEKLTINRELKNIHESMLQKAKMPSRIDACMIKTPSALLKGESFLLPEQALDDSGLDHEYYPMGITITGYDEDATYTQLMRQIKYVNTNGNPSHRVFTAQCSSTNGNIVTNVYKLLVDVIHAVHVPSMHGVQDNSIHVKNGHSIIDKEVPENKKITTAHASSGNMGGTIAIICVCVGFLMFMIVLGVIRIRHSHRRTTVVQVDNPEPEWDDTGLTIRVNPLETLQNENYDDRVAGVHCDDSDSEDDLDSCHDELMSSEDESEKIKDRDLEWDNSTLSF